MNNTVNVELEIREIKEELRNIRNLLYQIQNQPEPEPERRMPNAKKLGQAELAGKFVDDGNYKEGFFVKNMHKPEMGIGELKSIGGFEDEGLAVTVAYPGGKIGFHGVGDEIVAYASPEEIELGKPTTFIRNTLTWY